MKRRHMPRIDARYWLAIALASIFGTNAGDLYAHELGLGIAVGIAVLAALAAIVFAVERTDDAPREAYYWLVILIIRTGATNIADYLAFRVHIPAVPLAIGLAAALALLAWRADRSRRADTALAQGGALPDTGALYWIAMLVAGVFGTVLGDVCSHAVGEGVASIGLGLLLLAVLFATWGRTAGAIGLYWLTVAVARTAGTAIGDWLAENKILNIGLPLSTLITGTAFIGVLVLWRSRPIAEAR